MDEEEKKRLTILAQRGDVQAQQILAKVNTPAPALRKPTQNLNLNEPGLTRGVQTPQLNSPDNYAYKPRQLSPQDQRVEDQTSAGVDQALAEKMWLDDNRGSGRGIIGGLTKWNKLRKRDDQIKNTYLPRAKAQSQNARELKRIDEDWKGYEGDRKIRLTQALEAQNQDRQNQQRVKAATTAHDRGVSTAQTANINRLEADISRDLRAQENERANQAYTESGRELKQYFNTRSGELVSVEVSPLGKMYHPDGSLVSAEDRSNFIAPDNMTEGQLSKGHGVRQAKKLQVDYGRALKLAVALAGIGGIKDSRRPIAENLKLTALTASGAHSAAGTAIASYRSELDHIGLGLLKDELASGTMGSKMIDSKGEAELWVGEAMSSKTDFRTLLSKLKAEDDALVARWGVEPGPYMKQVNELLATFDEKPETAVVRTYTPEEQQKRERVFEFYPHLRDEYPD